MRQVRPSWTIRSKASGDARYLGPNSEGMSPGVAMISGGEVCWAAEEISHLIVNGEKSLSLTD